MSKSIKEELKVALAEMQKTIGSPTLIFPELLDMNINVENYKKFFLGGQQLLMDQMKDDDIITLMIFQPRSLYDYFDKSNITINIYSTSKKEFFFDINDVGKGNIYNSRWEAEKAAFIEALELTGDLRGKTNEDGGA